MLSRFDRIPACDRQTDRQTDKKRLATALSAPRIASRGKKVMAI